MRIPAVDDDVATLQQRQEFPKHFVHYSTAAHQHHYATRSRERADNCGYRRESKESGFGSKASSCVVVIVPRMHGTIAASNIGGKGGAHRAETKNADLIHAHTDFNGRRASPTT